MNTTHITKILDYLLLKEIRIEKTDGFKEYSEIFTDKQELIKLLKISTDRQQRKLEVLIKFLVRNNALIENKAVINKRKKYYTINLNKTPKGIRTYKELLEQITHQNKHNYKPLKKHRIKALKEFREETNGYDERLIKWKGN